MKARFAGALGLAAVVAVIGAQPAAAATEVGNRCAGSFGENEVTAISLANGPGSPIPATVPSAGVITRWTFTVALPVPPGALTEALQVYRPTGAPGQFQVVGESTPGPIVGGASTFETRIPVQPGDHLGAVARTFEGITGAIVCETGSVGDRVGWLVGPPPTGTVTVVEEEAEVQNPVVAFVEPDADNDGHGDETQDKCPQNAATQNPCPPPPPQPAPISLSATSVVKRSQIKVTLISSAQAQVTVAGTVRLGKGRTAGLKGGTQIIAPGALAQFIVPLPKLVTDKLKQLSRKRTLPVTLTATAPNASGSPTVTTLKAKLRGQAKPKPKRPKGQRG